MGQIRDLGSKSLWLSTNLTSRKNPEQLTKLKISDKEQHGPVHKAVPHGVTCSMAW